MENMISKLIFQNVGRVQTFRYHKCLPLWSLNHDLSYELFDDRKLMIMITLRRLVSL